MENAIIESSVTDELRKLNEIALRMINGESMKVIEFTTITEGKDSADVATLLVDDEIVYFVSNTSEDEGIDDFIELRSSKFMEMSISLPRPMFTRFKPVKEV